MVSSWPAKDKWSFDYFRKNYGDIEVMFVDKNFGNSKSYLKPSQKIKFGDYHTLVENNEPMDLRIFLFDIFKKVPELADDIAFPNLMNGFIKNYKFMFFGGKDSVTNLHYDLDCSNVFLTHFQTKKKIIIFPHEEKEKLVHLPFSTMALFNPEEPDYEKYPLAEHLRGYEGTLEHGETIFMPSLCWHYIRYIEGGFSLALRAKNSPFTIFKGTFNIAQHKTLDLGLSKLLGENWHQWKRNQAFKNAEEIMNQHPMISNV